jgi:hypothetical protein
VICQAKLRHVRHCFCFALLFVFIFSNALATMVIAPSFDRMVERADLIFTGQVTSQHSEWRNTGGQKSIVTLVSFRVQAVHKGSADSVVTLQFLGGTIGDTTLDVSEMPKFKQGERVVLFVEKNGASASPLIGFYHGKFSLKKDASGREAVLKHNGEPLTNVAEIGQPKRGGASAQSGLSHEDFAGKVRERVSRNKQ